MFPIRKRIVSVILSADVFAEVFHIASSHGFCLSVRIKNVHVRCFSDLGFVEPRGTLSLDTSDCRKTYLLEGTSLGNSVAK